MLSSSLERRNKIPAGNEEFAIRINGVVFHGQDLVPPFLQRLLQRCRGHVLDEWAPAIKLLFVKRFGPQLELFFVHLARGRQ